MHGGNVNHRQFDVHNFPNDGISPYPAYKNSGIEWLGRIPAHWEVKRLKSFAWLSQLEAMVDNEAR